MNERLFYLYRFLGQLVPVYPVYLLLFQAKGLTVAQISLLLIIWSITALMFEVPTGILADRWNRKGLLIIGKLFKAACYFSWFIADSFVLFAVGFILWGIGGALCSGTEEALLFDSLKAENREGQFDRILGNSYFYDRLGVVLSGVSGGALTAISMELTLVLSVLTMLLSACVAFFFKEVNTYRDKHAEAQAHVFRHYFATLGEGLKLCIMKRRLLLLILFSTPVICSAGVLDEYDQLVVSWLGLNIGYVGIWFSIRYLLEALGGGAAFWIKKLLHALAFKHSFNMIWLLSIVAGIALFAAAYFKTLLLLPLYGLFYLLMASAKVIFDDAVQQEIEDQGRATIYSMTSLLENLAGIGLYAVFGLSASLSGLQAALIAFSVYVLLLCVFFGRIKLG